LFSFCLEFVSFLKNFFYLGIEIINGHWWADFEEAKIADDFKVDVEDFLYYDILILGLFASLLLLSSNL